jgi:dTDP-4-dehydrorhamnose reductase
MKILITGGSGLLGQYLNLSLAKKYEILTLYNSNVGNCHQFNSFKIDLKNQNSLKNTFEKFKPNFVVHSAAITYSLLDNKYSLKEYYSNNVLVTKFVSEMCAEFNSKMIYISTDLVYDGNRGSYLDENSKLNPASPYAETKLLGEEYVKKIIDNYVILRLALLFGFGLNHSICHFQTMYQNFIENKSVKLFTDQFRSPISISEASKIIYKIIELDSPTGIYNLGGQERLSRYELGELLAKKIGVKPELLIPSSLKDAATVPYVKDVSLNINKIRNLGIEISSLEIMLNEILNYSK